MTAFKSRFLAILSVATIALPASVPSWAEANSSRVGSDLSLVIDGGSQVAVLPVIADTAQSNLLTYDFATGEVQFAAGVISADYDEPLFCFDMGAPQSPVSLRVTDPNGHVIIDDFDLETSLGYVLAAPSTLVVNPSVNQQCFFRSDQGVFGLFGMESPDDSVGGGVISRDRFEVNRSMSLEFQGVPEFVTLGETVNYDLVLTNTGTGDLVDVALQELFPENLAVYAAALSAGTWSCDSSGDAVCPGSSANPDSLRFEQMNSGGIDLTAGDSLTFSIERTVNASSITGESIRLQAGAAANPLATGTPFAVDEVLMTVIGQSAGLSIASTTATADSAETATESDDAEITVTVLDGNQNPVPNESVALDSAGGLTFTSPTTGVSDTNGEVVFTATSDTADDYTVSFSSGALNGNGSVTILPGAPDTFFLQATDDNAVADGEDTIEVQILVEDQNGNEVDSVLVEVDEDDGLDLPPSQFTDIDGIASFTATSTSTGVFEPVFSVAGVGSQSAAVEFEAGAPDGLEFVVQPPEQVTATVDFEVTLQTIDNSGHPVSDDQLTFVTLNLLPSVGQPQFLDSESVTNGEVTFTVNLGASQLGSGHRLQAVSSVTGFFGVNSNPFDVVGQ